MENTLKLVGKNSNEIFTLRYPSTLLDFCDFDFSFCAQEAIEVCNEALKTGTPDFDKISEIKKEIQSAHCFLQCSTRTAYDKVVYDCWIDYVCRRDNIGDSALWNRFIRCKTQFEKIIFQRLCDFRYNRAVNEWLNIIRVQDYAKNKVAFVFSNGMKSSQEAEERRNYFDLMFSVTARELGCRLEDLGVTKYYSICRTPGSPFLFPNVSKEIIRHVLAGFDYSDDYSDIDDYSENADEIAMDAFSRMKAGLPSDLSSYVIPAAKMENLSDRIYMPCGLKAAIDLEIDVIIESGMWLAKCKRCGLYYAKSKDYTEDYCPRRNIPSGKTCLAIYEEEHPRPKMTQALLERCNAVTDEMYSRVDKSMSVNEYNSWRTYLEAMKQKVDNGEISPSELEGFLEYSLEVDISKSKPILEVAKKEPEVTRERVVKPFIPERISRSDIKQYDKPAEREEPAEPEAKPSREGFFTSPSVQRQKNERPQISHIIRNGESLGSDSNSSHGSSGFQPFEAQYQQNRPQPVNSQSAEPPVQSYQEMRQPESQPEIRQPESQPEMRQQPPKKEERDPYENFKRLEERLEAERHLREERNSFKPLVGQERAAFVEDYPQAPRREQRPERRGPYPEHRDPYPEHREPYPEHREPYPEHREPYPEHREPFNGAAEVPPASGSRNEEQKPIQRIMRSGEYSEENLRIPSFDAQPEQFDRSADNGQPDDYRQSEQPQPELKQEPPKPRVIRKNAAAISAYGKMSGQPVSINPGDIQQPASEEPAYQGRPSDAYEQPVHDNHLHSEQAPQIDSEMLEPFKDIGSIFDVLEQSEGALSRPRRRSEHDYEDDYTGDTGYREDPHYSDETRHDRAEKTERTERFTPDTHERIYPTQPQPLRNDEVPDGFWKEDRGLFRNGGMPEAEPPSRAASDEYSDSYDREEEAPELPQPEAAKGGRHPKSSKTQRLYDVIMREPDDNPNFRRKK